jgi:hypothetical protein
VKVRPYRVDGVSQLRAEVKRMGLRGGLLGKGCLLVCPPADGRIWSITCREIVRCIHTV